MICKSSRAFPWGIALLAALTTPFATACHLAAEAASLGGACVRILLSPHHAYLAALNLAAILILAVGLGLSAPPGERRRRIALFVTSLPGRGRGVAFVVWVVATQLCFFAATQLVEGDPVAAGHLLFGLLAALLSAVAGALLIASCQLRILRIVAGLYQRPGADAASVPAFVDDRAPVPPISSRLFAVPGVSNRPPPLFAS